MNTSCTISSAAQVLPVMRKANRYIAAWCRRYRSVKASSSPLAARRNRTSSLSCSAILISPDKTFCPLASIISRPGLEKFPRFGAWIERMKTLFSQQVRRKGRLLGVESVFGVATHCNLDLGLSLAGERSLLLLRRLEHACGNSADEAPRDEAFAVRAEIISEAGNDVAFAGGQGFQPGADDFFGGLGLPLESLLAGDGVEFRFC